MHPTALLSYYPNYAILDEILSNSEYKNLNIYIDLKNNFQTLYMEHAILSLVESSLATKCIDTSMFNAILSFLSFHKLYSIKRNLNLNFYIFFESGESYYHKNISKKYKISRKIDNLYGLEKDKRDLFKKILQKNFGLIEKALNRIPKIKVIRLLNLEADFIPYYLLTRGFVKSDSENCNIIYSNDHDLHQSIINNHVYVFSKSGKSNKKIIKKDEVINNFFKSEDEFFPDEYLPFFMSIVGDVGDDVDGIKGIGSIRLKKIIKELISMITDIDTLYNNVRKSEFIFNTKQSISGNKLINKIINKEIENKKISNNLKLVSFELISRELDDPSSTDIIKKRNQIDELLKNSNVVTLGTLKEALDKARIYLGDDSLDNLYFNWGK